MNHRINRDEMDCALQVMHVSCQRHVNKIEGKASCTLRIRVKVSALFDCRCLPSGLHMLCM